ncbi:hypothetical protein [Paenibacillus arenilitoris]|uniref:C1q domain-containing protein n=1 Tax=Paenibacillus arenilitoris TaxID=2772299 RepID=A0A927H4H2_9BACL|nr:hypothetical protein [Paenibacillus arenilitoris]MBD2867377.1 hypothetical protein [Paenibacillus arenilitoris]
MTKQMVRKNIVKKRSVTFKKTKTISASIVTEFKSKKRCAPKRAVKCVPCKHFVRKSAVKRTSAFRATASQVQTVTAGGPSVQVLFQNEDFDVNREYNPLTSTFRPRKSGIYSLSAAVTFALVTATPPINVQLTIRVIGTNQAITDFEVFSTAAGIIDASGLLRLNAGDSVQVFIGFSGTAPGGSIGILPESLTRFEGARIR